MPVIDIYYKGLKNKPNRWGELKQPSTEDHQKLRRRIAEIAAEVFSTEEAPLEWHKITTRLHLADGNVSLAHTLEITAQLPGEVLFGSDPNPKAFAQRVADEFLDECKPLFDKQPPEINVNYVVELTSVTLSTRNDLREPVSA